MLNDISHNNKNSFLFRRSRAAVVKIEMKKYREISTG